MRHSIDIHAPASQRDLFYLLWLPVYLTLFVLTERFTPSDGYLPTQMFWDNWFPFCEWFVLPYVSWYPFMIATGIILLCKDRPAYRRYMLELAVTFLFCCIVYILIPNGQDLRPAELNGNPFCISIIRHLYSIDTNTNVCPSVHVVGSLAAACALNRSRALRPNKLLRFFGVFCGIVISISICFVKQHAFIDLVLAAILSMVVEWIIYRRLFPIQNKKDS